MKTNPSIPQSTHFYEELEDKNFLVSKDDKEKSFSSNQIGPGFYEPNYKFIKPKIYVCFMTHKFIIN